LIHRTIKLKLGICEDSNELTVRVSVTATGLAGEVAEIRVRGHLQPSPNMKLGLVEELLLTPKESFQGLLPALLKGIKFIPPCVTSTMQVTDGSLVACLAERWGHSWGMFGAY